MASVAGPLMPTYHGFVHSSMDGLVLFEACLSGKLHHVPRRPHDRERPNVIKSGSVFIYEENASGIKRWTDGVAWSPSRILGNFLIYRELEKPFPPGEKKRANKRKRSHGPPQPESPYHNPSHPADSHNVVANGVNHVATNHVATNHVATAPLDPHNHHHPLLHQPTAPAPPQTPPAPPAVAPSSTEPPKSTRTLSEEEKETERSLIGSLVDSYGFRPGGLVKKTMSISVHGVSHHMVSYYKVEDVKNNSLSRPPSDARLQDIVIRPELFLKQNFRTPVEESDPFALDRQLQMHTPIFHGLPSHPYAVRPDQYFGGLQHQQPQPQPPPPQQSPQHPPQHAHPAMYGAVSSPHHHTYPGTSAAAPVWSTTATTATTTGAVAYDAQPAYAAPPYGGYYRGPDGDQPAPEVKNEGDAASSPPAVNYGPQYTSPYPGMPSQTQPHQSQQQAHPQAQQQAQQQGEHRNGAHPTPMVQQAYHHSPVPQSPSSFVSMGAARSTYAAPHNASPVSAVASTQHQHHHQHHHQQQHQQYGAGNPNGVPGHSYAVRSPAQAYPMHHSPATPQQHGDRSPHAAASHPHGPPQQPPHSHPHPHHPHPHQNLASPTPAAPLPYRTNSYVPPPTSSPALHPHQVHHAAAQTHPHATTTTTAPTTDLSALGIGVIGAPHPVPYPPPGNAAQAVHEYHQAAYAASQQQQPPPQAYRGNLGDMNGAGTGAAGAVNGGGLAGGEYGV